MATPFIKVYEKFLNKITDFDMSYLTDDELEYFCHDLLTTAVVNCNPVENDLTLNEEQDAFVEELLPVEIEIIACLMVVEWHERQMSSSTYTKLFVGTKDEKFFAPANQLSTLSERAKALEIKAKKLRRDYLYRVTNIE